MLRTSVAATAFWSTLVWATASLAFEPIPYGDVSSLVGKHIYAAGNKRLGNGKAVVYAGDPLVLVEAKPFQQGTYNYVTVRTAAGVEGEIQLRFLSRTALKYSLSNPGEPKTLLKALLEDAYPLGAKMHSIREKHGYNLTSAHPDDYHLVDSSEESFDFARHLLHGLVHGANQSKTQILGNDETSWLGANDTLLTWYADGMPSGATKQTFVNAVLALNDLSSVNSHGSEMAYALSEKASKPWLADIKDAPAATRAKIDSEKLQELDAQIADKKKRIAAAFADAAKEKEQVK